MITDELIQRYLDDPKATHPFYTEAVEIARQVQVHTRQIVPEDLLTIERPNEPESVKAYRSKVYECPTHSAASKVITNIGKISRSQGFTVTYPDTELPIIQEGKDLATYLIKDFAEWDSLTNYLFGFIAEQAVNDPNGILAIYPRHLETGQQLRDGIDYAEPFPYYYTSAEVLEYVEGEHVVILKKDDTTALLDDQPGRVILFIDRYQLTVWEQYGKSTENKYRERIGYPIQHNIGYLPAFQLASNRVNATAKGYKLYDSFLSACLPDWREAIRRYSDVVACLIDHVAPEKWQQLTKPCNDCNGTTTGADAGCGTCKGVGYTTSYSPYGIHELAPIQVGMNQAPVTVSGPGMGYVEKDIEAVRFIKEEVKDKIIKGLDALGLSILENTPLNQSGTAKEIDRSEADTFFHNVARHLVDNILRPCIYFIQEWRYPMLSPEVRRDVYNAVEIKVPTTFNLINPSYFQQRAAQARTDKENPILIAEAELAHAKNAYGENSLAYLILEAAAELDPLPGYTPDEKTNLQMAGAASIEDLTVSTQLQNLIRRAYRANPEFFDLETEEQREAIYALLPKPKNPLLGTMAIAEGGETVTDVQAEAQARLKGTVGGVQGILAIQESVGKGLTDYPAGVAMMVSIYGYTEQEATNILGTPKKIAIEAPAA